MDHSSKGRKPSLGIFSFLYNPFGGQFKSEEDVLRWFHERGVMIRSAKAAPEPEIYMNERSCKLLLESYVEYAFEYCIPNPGKGECRWRSSKDRCERFHRRYYKNIKTMCGLIVEH